ncbi:uncharacterized protein LOC143469800 [Clavelina lepadiformis]|uniref:uncharacterized protein LOC143469800 n=1 Tax=Clavelina lepadiformis TaxID=159417 RepID=UPI0040410831
MYCPVGLRHDFNTPISMKEHHYTTLCIGMLSTEEKQLVMFQHLSQYEKQKQSCLPSSITASERRVKFHDQSESGYSTTTSSDDGNHNQFVLMNGKNMSSDVLKRMHFKHAVQVLPLMGYEQQNHLDQRQSVDPFSRPQPRHIAEDRDSTEMYNQSFEEISSNCNTTNKFNVVDNNHKSEETGSRRSSTSPESFDSNSNHELDSHDNARSYFDQHTYYDPYYDLCGLSQNSASNLTKTGGLQTQLDADESASESSGNRGILKKSHRAKSVEILTDPIHSDSSEWYQELNHNSISYSDYSTPVTTQQDCFHGDPIRVPAMYPSGVYNSPTSQSVEGNRKSAFTPVKSKKQRANSSGDLSDGSLIFSPVQGPAVLDYVTSCDQFKSLQETDRSFPAQHLLPTQDKSGIMSEQTDCSTTKRLNNNRQIDAAPYTQGESDIHQNHPSSVSQSSQQEPAKHAIGRLTKDLRNQHLKGIKDNDSFVENNNSRHSIRHVPNVETLVNDAVRLQDYVENVSAKDLKNLLIDKLDSKDPKMIKALAVLIPKTATEQRMAHCVRCHKDYNPKERSRCYLPHPQTMVFKVGQDSEGTDFICDCCSTSFRLLKMGFYEETTNALLTGHCYSGQHTSDPESVDYRKDDGAAKSCEENGCVEFYV